MRPQVSPCNQSVRGLADFNIAANMSTASIVTGSGVIWKAALGRLVSEPTFGGMFKPTAQQK